MGRIKKQYIDNYVVNEQAKILMEERATNARKVGLQPLKPPSPDILFDPTGAEAQRRAYQWFQRAGITSGRYLEERNNQYLNNYLKALEKYPNKKLWEDTIARLKELKNNKNLMHSGDFIGDILPPMNDWYPSNKGFNRRSSVFHYKDITNIDTAQVTLIDDITEALDILGVNKVIKNGGK